MMSLSCDVDVVVVGIRGVSAFGKGLSPCVGSKHGLGGQYKASSEHMEHQTLNIGHWMMLSFCNVGIVVLGITGVFPFGKLRGFSLFRKGNPLCNVQKLSGWSTI